MAAAPDADRVRVAEPLGAVGRADARRHQLEVRDLSVRRVGQDDRKRDAVVADLDGRDGHGELRPRGLARVSARPGGGRCPGEPGAWAQKRSIRRRQTDWARARSQAGCRLTSGWANS